MFIRFRPFHFPALLGVVLAMGPDLESAWTRHAIDAGYAGADGVRLGDANRDGFPDIATGWEEEGVVRLYLNPGPENAKDPWPAVTVGRVPYVEDAVFSDLDGDGTTDIISSAEGQTQSIFVHWAPSDPQHFMDASKWETEPIPVTQGASKWMFALPADIDGKNGMDLFLGSKNPHGQVSWLRSPSNPRDLDAWTLHPLTPAMWIMSLRYLDLNEDDQPDLVYVDRRGPEAGVYGLIHPKDNLTADQAWLKLKISRDPGEYMFLDIEENQQTLHLVVPIKNQGIRWFEQTLTQPQTWEETIIRKGASLDTGFGKAIAMGDLNLDGHTDLVWSAERAYTSKRGVIWLEQRADSWQTHDLSGPEGIKFDRIELIDLDHDGDLDVLTCEEREGGPGLGVFWYENPHLNPPR